METTQVLQRVLDGVDTVIHLGAGRCRELPDYLAAERKRIVLVEANPSVARVLQAQSSTHKNVHVVQRAISVQEEETTLYVYNLLERSSLRKATGLRELYPGLRLVREVPVTACSPAKMLSELDVEDAGKICLIVDTPGEEHAILKAMAREHRLGCISTLLLYCPQAPMYENAAARQDIIDLLDAQGFEIIEEAGGGVLEQAVALRLNALKLENRRLQEHLAAVDADLTGLRQRFSREVAQLRDSVSRKETELRTLATEMKKLERNNARQRKTAVQGKERRAALKKERDELRAEVDRLRKVKDDQAARLAERESAHNVLMQRQTLLDMEVARAEGQVRLIRDVLLSDREI